ncbi:MAG: hypothetical protein HZC54_06425 [Verrucomicrobia bacterium]|nr:hypothetical protein [Verrucomicrobiota bacterium]
MKAAILILSSLAGLASVVMAGDKPPIFPPPQSAPKFKQVEVVVAPDPTVVPLEVERRLRWRTERELVSRQEPNFELGKNGLHLDIKFLHFIEPKLPIPQIWRAVPGPGGTRVMMPQTPAMPMPPVGEARILLTFSQPDGTKLSEFDLAQPVPVRDRWDGENAYIAVTAKIAAEYARYYFLDKPAK